MNISSLAKTVVEEHVNRCLPEFCHVSHFWDKKRLQVTAKILPGDFYMTVDKVAITTTLGSCVAACLWDDVAGIGGMNHFMLPITDKHVDDIDWGSRGMTTDATRYGNYAMEYLINAILKNGGNKKNIKAKIFGGGKVVHRMSDIGERNIEFVRSYLDIENIAIESADVGDIYPRKVIFEPFTGKAYVKRIIDDDDSILRRENNYRSRIDQKPAEGDVELF